MQERRRLIELVRKRPGDSRQQGQRDAGRLNTGWLQRRGRATRWLPTVENYARDENALRDESGEGARQLVTIEAAHGAIDQFHNSRNKSLEDHPKPLTL